MLTFDYINKTLVEHAMQIVSVPFIVYFIKSAYTIIDKFYFRVKTEARAGRLEYMDTTSRITSNLKELCGIYKQKYDDEVKLRSETEVKMNSISSELKVLELKVKVMSQVIDILIEVMKKNGIPLPAEVMGLMG